ncbi:MAG TPA: PEP-CTERM sorting domain-containing protein [Bryobacteraceae bacterium]|nr:PEP-CTERM sorting domain-containing protein [Bryobacteraceae bacterium]
MSTSRIISKVVLFSLVLALSLTVSWAGTLEGSTSVARTFTDTNIGQVMIFNGDFFTNGVTVSTFSFFDSNGSGTRWVTPILFQENVTGQFTVVGIGTSDSFSTNVLQVFPFALQNGTANVTSTNFTFGFIESQVTSAGNETANVSAGGVDFNNGVDPGTDVSADLGSTNDWLFTPSPGANGVNVQLGSTFNIPGVASGLFPLNRSTQGGFNQDRTYSANLNSTIVQQGVPEPGTLGLFTSGAGLLLAGLIRFRRRR